MMGRWHLATNFGIGPAWPVAEATKAPAGLLADAHIGAEYLTTWPVAAFAIGLKADAGFRAFTGNDGGTTTARLSEIVRGGTKITVARRVSVETLIGIGPAQDLWRGGKGSWDWHVTAVLAIDLPLSAPWQISPSVGYVWESAFDGPTHEHHGLLFGVRLGGQPAEDRPPSVANTSSAPSPGRAPREAAIAEDIGRRTIEPGPLGDPAQYPQTFVRLRERLNRQGAASDVELERYVTLFLLAGLFTFDTAYLAHFVLDPHILDGWRRRPTVLLAGLRAYFALARVAADPAAHPEHEEHNALLLLHDLLALSVPRHRAPHEISAAEFGRTAIPYRLGRSRHRGVDMGCNMYLLLLIKGGAGRLPSEPVLRQLAAWGGFTSLIASVRAMKRRRR